jgi:putative RNA 2'-phosphotransferase
LQGHSFDVDLQLKPSVPPKILYHGTCKEVEHLIRVEGIKKQKRHAAHLTENFQIALLTGLRHGDPIALEVKALEMHKDGYKFFLTENNVWLTDYVPNTYIVHYEV